MRFMRNRIGIIAMMLTAATLSIATTYYVDSQGGNDAANGSTSGAPWKTLGKVNSMTFGGDTVLFKCGGVWSGTLEPKGSGTSGHPMVFNKYSTGNLPVINGAGALHTVHFSNQEYFEISNLEITNIATPHQTNRRGISIEYPSYGRIAHSIAIRDMYIHDVDGKSDSTWIYWQSGGIWIRINGAGTTTAFDGLTIERNRLLRIHGQGIIVHRGGGSSTGVRSKNVIIHENYLDSIGGDGIVLHGSKNGIVEHNVLHHGGWQVNGCCAGIWGAEWNDSAFFQFNEVYDLEPGICDRQPFDSDFREYNQFCQYNYSHNNAGGFFLFVPSCHNTTIRYNISQNDHSRLFNFNTGWPNAGDVLDSSEKIYNNTFYIGTGINTAFALSNDFYRPKFFYNNIIVNKGITPIPVIGSNNCFYGNITGTPGDSNFIADPQFANPGSGQIGFPSAAGYQLQPTSICIKKGKRLANIGARDFFGNPLPASGPVDIGAFQYTGAGKPACMITAPANNQTFTASPAAIPITANAWHTGAGTITKVAFYQGTTKIGEDANGADEWSFTWSGVVDGHFILTAAAFDNSGDSTTSAPIAIIVGYRSPDNPAQTTCGFVDYAYYEGTWSALPDFGILTPIVKSGTCAGFSLAIRNRVDYFGVRYAGYLDVPADGVYKLYVNSNDGSRLLIGADTVVSNDHFGSSQERSGSIALKAGKHAITLDYYQAATPLDLAVSWECAATGVTKRAIPAGNLCSSGTVSISSGIDALKAVPNAIRVAANGGRLSMQFSIPGGESEIIAMRIVDHQGKTAATAAKRLFSPGNHVVALDARTLSPGRYLCVFSIGKAPHSVAFTIIK